VHLAGLLRKEIDFGHCEKLEEQSAEFDDRESIVEESSFALNLQEEKKADSCGTPIFALRLETQVKDCTIIAALDRLRAII
jgi:hypothetical protein